MTDQHDLVHRLANPLFKIPKIYRVTVNADLPSGLEYIFSSGTLVLRSEKTACLPANYTQLGPREATLAIFEGRYHQVRRMFAAAANVSVVTLHRTHFGPWNLQNLQFGQWIHLLRAEIEKYTNN